MSKNFIPTVHKGKAHEADIFNVQYSKFATITTSGDGYLKVWKNYLNEGDLPEDNVQSKFLTKAGLHHTSFLEFKDLETKKGMLFIGTISFTGELFIEKYDLEKNEFENDLELRKILNFDTLMEEEQDTTKSYYNIIEKNTFYLIKFLPKNLNNKITMDKLLLTTVDSKVIVLDLVYQSETSTFDVTRVELLQITEKSLGFKTLQQSETPFITCMDASNKLSNVLTLGFNTSHVLILNLFTLTQLFNISLISKPIRCVKISNNATLLAISHDLGINGCVSLYDIETGDFIGDYTNNSHTAKDTNTFTHKASCLSMDFNESDEFIITAGLDGVVNVWETITRERVGRIKISCNDIENNSDILDTDPITLESLTNPGIMDVKYIHKNTRGGLGGAKNEGLVVVALDKGIRWFREAGGI
ncbi:related to Antiviral protein SKI8 [Hanseniaspora guilliermondii]|uniref:Related to Antiviral protein SKI8 n=1 Tax=Hanseniaspora guilliermondii TaxID=56406 RepID=A0A1L0CRM1_9ASCO|nr:related to Antiviral protein SKI8 [Hanseniaspora guilliermondii]